MSGQTGGVPTIRSNPASEILFEVLGPVAIVSGDKRIQLRSGRQRVILAMLLLNANTGVSGDMLVDAVWEGAPPSTARSQLYICVSALRRTLREVGADHLIATAPNAYLIRLEANQLDLFRFEHLTNDAAVFAKRGQMIEAVDVQRHALDLWHGPALEGIISSMVRSRAAKLDEDRMVAEETCVEWDLALGRDRELISGLISRVADHPLRDRSRAQLMLALYRSGRRAEALETYREGRSVFREQLGLEPGEELRRLEGQILAGDPELQSERTVSMVVPAHQLPGNIADFVGRADLIREITGVLTAVPERDRLSAVPVVVISGICGVGKSTLAVHVAHLLANERFPDGQLYANLGGPDRPRHPNEVLGRFLRALGVSHAALPDSVVERAELYRSLLSDRQILILLEDAVDEDQMRPLLPGSPTCAVLITSTARLVGLSGTHHVDVRDFSETEAAALLTRTAGPHRIELERDEVAELTRLVGGLPLALRIVGSRLAARPHWTLRTMSQRLSDEARRLDELRHGGLAVRTVISLVYKGLTPQEQFLLCVLCEFHTDGFPAWVAAAALDMDLFDTVEVLENLVELRLIIVASAGPETSTRYRAHELIRIFAREQISADDSAHEAALARVCGGWLCLAEKAHDRLYGGPYTVLHGSAPRWTGALDMVDIEEPLDWFDLESANLRAAVKVGAAAELDEFCWDLAMTLVTLFEARGYTEMWEETHENALAAVRRARNRRGEAALLCSLGSLYLTRGLLDKAGEVLPAAATMLTELGDTRGRALAVRNVAILKHGEGALELARQYYEQAMVDFRLVGDHIGQAHTLVNMGTVDATRGRVNEAMSSLDEALQVSRSIGHKRTEAQALYGKGMALLGSGNPRTAEYSLRNALILVRAGGDRIGQMRTLLGLGRIQIALHEQENAVESLNEALMIADELGDDSVRAKIRDELVVVGKWLDDKRHTHRCCDNGETIA